MTKLSNRSIWESISEGADMMDLIELAPDEFHAWIRDTAVLLTEQAQGHVRAANYQYGRIAYIVGTGDRKEFAALAVMSDYSDMIFRLLDGKPVDAQAWKRVRPETIEYAEFA